MKRVILLLLFAIPFICWGQSTNERFVKPFQIEPVSTNVNLEIDPEAINPPFQEIPRTVHVVHCRRFYTTPLLLIDGVVKENLEGVNSEDIEKIDILKGRDAEVLFGSRGMAGVIMVTMKEGRSELTTYKATVLDTGFDSFVATQQGIDYYSSDYLKNKNRILVNEWNNRCNQPLKYNPQIYEATIDYDPQNIYGKDVEYTLYMFFRFMEAQHGNLFNSLTKL
ncbi:DUF6146 family protein [Dysgonomonas sp. 25]|uniref:DUF6146 family protein n=1 Tax=Dysgonomonas sp. 25 TaxID=2302933 RepID=UPI0013D6741E|nr:DUF6146 family protein [Dysgonomonas sp. 25]NDV68716.1 hypothetical protein [Dysgonomonas sp. 25]